MTGPPAPKLEAPAPLKPDHVTDAFDSGGAEPDDWLKRCALHNEAEGGSRTYVVTAGQCVVGYYSLAAGSVFAGIATGRVRRNMPNPIPVVILGRLAIDRAWQGRGLGADMLRDAVLHVIAAGGTIGVRAILLHAISDQAEVFYERFGFRDSPLEEKTLMITMAEAQRVLGGGG